MGKVSETYRTASRLRRRGHKVIFPGMLRVLLAAIAVRSQGLPVTHRRVCERLGKMPNWTLCAFRQLRKAGFLNFQERTAGSVVPRYEFIPAERR